MDKVTLALAKSYTDERIKTGGIDKDEIINGVLAHFVNVAEVGG